MARRVRLRFAPGVVVEFVDRVVGLERVERLAERGTRFPVVVYGPEGCGKTALFRQAFEVLREHGYSVVHVSPLEARVEDRLVVTNDLVGIASRLAGAVASLSAGELVEVSLRIVVEALRARRRRIAVIADDVFQAVGVERAELLVKRLLNLIEYPPRDYESIVVLVGSSEGVTRSRIGRHGWALVEGLWNLPRSGFQELYEQLPGVKPGVEEAWRLTGGNPRMLARLYEAEWRVEEVVAGVARERGLRGLVRRLTRRQLEWLRLALEDPDVLDRVAVEAVDEAEKREATRLLELLVEANLVMELWERGAGWLDEPPPERDPLLGVGRWVAWQTPLHREAVRRTLEALTG